MGHSQLGAKLKGAGVGSVVVLVIVVFLSFPSFISSVSSFRLRYTCIDLRRSCPYISLPSRIQPAHYIYHGRSERRAHFVFLVSSLRRLPFLFS